MPKVNFFSEDIEFSLLHPRKTSQWIQLAVKKEKKKLKELNYVFCSDNYLSSLNKEYLNHSTLTDIITFDNSETKDAIEGDIFISVERVRDNSAKFNVDFDSELHRVVIHGALHLMGYKDKLDGDKMTMRGKEDAYLSLRK
jgi:probable rRNA maturation factor